MALATAILLAVPTTLGAATGNAGVASGSFTVSYNGQTLLTDTVTFADGGAGGTFTPSSLTVPAGNPPTPQTVTYTPAAGASGNITLTASDSGVLALTPGTAVYTVFVPIVAQDFSADTSLTYYTNPSPADWSVSGGNLVPATVSSLTANQLYVAPALSGYFNGNVKVRVNCTAPAANTNGAAPIILRVVDASNYYIGFFNSNGSGTYTLFIRKCVAGVVTSLALATLTLPAGAFYLEFCAVGSSPTVLTLAAYNTSGDTQIGSTVTFSDSVASSINSTTARSWGVLPNYLAGTKISYPKLTGYGTTATVSYTLSGPPSGPTNAASTNFTVNLVGTSGGSGVTWTPNDSGTGGAFTPSTVSVAATTLGTFKGQTFTYTAAVSGTETISTTNNAGLADPAGLSYVSAPGLTLTAPSPSSGVTGTPSQAFTVGGTAGFASTVIVTPNDNGAGGSFSPATVTLGPLVSTATFTYNSVAVGTQTIGLTNNGGLVNPTTVSYVSSQGWYPIYTFDPSVTSSLSDWTIYNSAAWAVSGGKLVPPSVNNLGQNQLLMALSQNFLGNIKVRAYVDAGAVTATNGAIVAAIRATDNSNYYYGFFNSNGSGTYTLAIRKDVAGVLTSLTSATATQPAAAFYLEFAAVGTSLTLALYRTSDDVQYGTTLNLTDSTWTSATLRSWGLIPSYVGGTKLNYTKIIAYASVPASYAVTEASPPSSVNGVASRNFRVVVTGTPAADFIVTPASTVGGDTFTPSTVTIPAGTTNGSATFTITPSSVAARTISYTNNSGAANPASQTFTGIAGPASTAIGLEGPFPSSGFNGEASANFTVAADGSTLSGSVVVTPSDSAGGGTFTPTTITLSTGTISGTFTYTPGSNGTKNISITNNGGLTNGPSVAYVVTTDNRAIVLTAPVQYKVFQRSRVSNTGAITIAGSVTNGIAGQSIEASWNGSGYQTIATGVTTSFSGTLTGLTPGQGTLAVRIVGFTAVNTTVLTVGVGEVVLCSGQSNMDGRGTNHQVYSTTYSGPFTLSMWKVSGGWAALADPTGIATSNPDGSYAVLLAGALATSLSVPVAVVNSSHGGTSVVEGTSNPYWFYSTDPTTLYGTVQTAVSTAGPVGFLIWHQGETDEINTGGYQATVQANYNTLFGHFLADFGYKPMTCQLQKNGNGGAYGNEAIVNPTILAVQQGGASLTGPNLSLITACNAGNADGAGWVHIETDAGLLAAANAFEALMAPLMAPVSSVVVSPPTATVAGLATQQFTEVVNGPGPPSQTGVWTTNGGSVTSGGLFTAPAATGSPQTIIVTFTSSVDPTQSGTATVTVPAAGGGGGNIAVIYGTASIMVGIAI